MAIRCFSEQFSKLINPDIPRSPAPHILNDRNSDIPTHPESSLPEVVPKSLAP